MRDGTLGQSCEDIAAGLVKSGHGEDSLLPPHYLLTNLCLKTPRTMWANIVITSYLMIVLRFAEGVTTNH